MSDEFDRERRTPTGPIDTIDWLDARTRRLEMRDAVMFGVEGDGDGGAWQRHRREHDAMRARVDVLDAFRGKALLLVTLGGSALGIIAGVIAVVVEKIAGGH